MMLLAVSQAEQIRLGGKAEAVVAVEPFTIWTTSLDTAARLIVAVIYVEWLRYSRVHATALAAGLCRNSLLGSSVL